MDDKTIINLTKKIRQWIIGQDVTLIFFNFTGWQSVNWFDSMLNFGL